MDPVALTSLEHATLCLLRRMYNGIREADYGEVNLTMADLQRNLGELEKAYVALDYFTDVVR